MGGGGELMVGRRRSRVLRQNYGSSWVVARFSNAHSDNLVTGYEQLSY